MKKSKYNIIIEQSGVNLIFNSLNHTCVILNDKNYKEFCDIEKSSENYNAFVEAGFFVEDNVDETELFLYNSRKILETDKSSFYRILTTTACNAKCFYCYEKGIEVQTMNETTADQVCDFIVQQNPENKYISVEWFGGEPLVNNQIITYICKKLEKLGYKVSSRMITNGYLFNDELLTSAKNIWNLQSVQITLDGLKDTYEKVKSFSEPNAFEKVVGNIKKLLDNNIFVNIRLNYDTYNLNEILSLIDYLSDRFSSYKNVFVSARKIMYDDKNNDLISSENEDIIILRKLMKCGLQNDIINRLKPRYKICPACILSNFVIMPNGDLFKCSKEIKNSIYKVGDIYNNVNDYNVARWCSPKMPEKCLNCNMLPLCNFGCRNEYLQNKPYCMFSEKYVKEIFKTYIECNIDKIKLNLD